MVGRIRAARSAERRVLSKVVTWWSASAYAASMEGSQVCAGRVPMDLAVWVMVAAAAFKNLTVEEFARMAADKRNVILDVRTPAEFQAGHISGAVNLDVSASDFQARAALLERSKIYLVHCASGVRSVRACEQLNRLDVPNLYNLPGGFRAWAKAGKPVEK